MTPPLRYLLIATHVPASGAGGGMVRYTVELAAALAARPDVELHLLAQPAAVPVLAGLVPRSRVHPVAALPTTLRSVVERFGDPLPPVGGGFDVVHGPKHLLPRRCGGALRVLTVHDMLPFDRPWDFAFAKRHLLRGPYLASVREADLLVAVSSASRARLLDYVPEVAPRTVVVPLAVSRRLDGAAGRAVEPLAGRRFALVVGDASPRKNLALAVETWPEVRAAVPDAVLAVAGPRTWHGDHRGRSWDEMVAAGAVVPLGHVPDRELTWLYGNAAVVLCPSLLEGYGLPAVEAAAFGAPVLTSDDPALCEASGPTARHVPAWDRARWIQETVRALDAGRGPGAPGPDPRTWTDVGAQTVDAVRAARRDTASPAPGSGPSPADRAGVHPYSAPLRVLHVVGADAPWSAARVARTAERHRAQGWRVDVVAAPPAPAGVSTDHDVVALHGLAAGRLRSTIRGRVPTVVVAGGAEPGGAPGTLREARLGRWTSALVVEPRVAPRWSRIVVPLTSMPGTDASGDPDAEAVAALLVRARAWGRTAGPDPAVERRPAAPVVR